MPSIPVTAKTVAITAATALGELTMASNDGLMPGAKAWVYKNDDSARARVLILFQTGTTKITVRKYPVDANGNINENAPPSYGRSDMSAFTATSTISMENQLAPVNPAFSARSIP